MTISLAALSVNEKSLRDYDMQIVLCACHRDIEQAALLFQFLGGAGGQIGWNAAIDDIEDEDGFPLLTLAV